MTRKTIMQAVVNRLKERGRFPTQIDLWKANSYHVIEMTLAGTWSDQSVHVPALRDLTLDQWVDEYLALADELEEMK